MRTPYLNFAYMQLCNILRVAYAFDPAPPFLLVLLAALNVMSSMLARVFSLRALAFLIQAFIRHACFFAVFVWFLQTPHLGDSIIPSLARMLQLWGASQRVANAAFSINASPVYPHTLHSTGLL